MVKQIFTSLLGITLIAYVCGHGRLMDPPSRSSVWRIPEFKHLNPPPNYSDNQLNCGGAALQHEQNGGKCGICGDPYNVPRPRENELGGFFDKGIIVRNYKSGQLVDIDVELTASHKGHFEFRICDLAEGFEDQTCFNKHLLTLADGTTRFPIPSESGHYYPQVQLPSNLTCSHCILQWHYVAGNNWGFCEDGTGALGCGPQETFRGCADISIE